MTFSIKKYIGRNVVTSFDRYTAKDAGEGAAATSMCSSIQPTPISERSSAGILNLRSGMKDCSESCGFPEALRSLGRPNAVRMLAVDV